MKELFSLGEIYPSDFLKEGETPHCPPVELKMCLDHNGVARLEKTAPKEYMYGRYWYRSSVTKTMKDELCDIVQSILRVKRFRKTNNVWVDIACNDGTLLSCVPHKRYSPKEFIRIGVDPANDEYKAQSIEHADSIIQDYFRADLLGDIKADVITAIAMFYDLEEPEKFLADVHKVLADDGIFVMQLSYTPLMLQQLAFDNICHEHIFYYSFGNLKALLETNGFRVVDCQLNNTNGGSFRVYIMKESANINLFAAQPHRDVCNFRMTTILEHEKTLELSNPVTWLNFYERVNQLKNTVVDFIKKANEEKKTVWAYGASTKGNTLLQYFGLDNSLIHGIAERSPEKYGLRTVGTNIPIYPEDVMRECQPDYLLILPWHFITEFRERECKYLSKGGSFIVPMPKFEIITKDTL